MDFEQSFSISLKNNLKNNKEFSQTKRVFKPNLNKSYSQKKHLYRKDDENSLSYGSLTELTENVYALSEEEEFYEINITEDQKHTYSSSSLESVDINSDSNSEKGENSNDINTSKYEKLKTDEYGFIINDVFHKRTYNIESGNTKKKENYWINLFKNFSLGNWDSYKPKIVSESSCRMCDKLPELEKYCRDGIPQSFRGYVWSTLAGTENIKKKNLYYDLCNSDPLPIDEIILKDITRCYPDHIMFNDKNYYGQNNLYNVLKAYSRYNPSIGYCQGMGFLAGILLMFIPAEDAFWLLVSTIKNYGISGYYSQNLDKLKSDNEIFSKILKQKLPHLYNHLVDLEIDTILFTTEWFLCLFSKTLPWPCLLRVWDLFYYYGKSIIIKAGIALLQYVEKPLLSKCEGLSKDECLNITLDIILHIYDVIYTDKYCQCYNPKNEPEEDIKVFNQKHQPQDIILKSSMMNESENEDRNHENETNDTENSTDSKLILPPPPVIHSHEHRYKQHASNSINRSNTSFYTSVSTINNYQEKEKPKNPLYSKCKSKCLCFNCFDIETFLNSILNIKISKKFEDLLKE
ncbi:RabGAP/TBC [Piromyces finnis]|uniref:RabGAP/TBC n=1 Tax=Piromyces finnis TaxID=1754191 RepID=A0A1Y1VKD9_9FUNG|nr:RabGAP/TBC [Piromyces finnis]|eukprot:ORX58551.1 RabGAP/TBC [Piromyces finnis]